MVGQCTQTHPLLAADLVDGAVYSGTFSYKDAVGNTAATQSVTGLVFAGSSTLAPTFTSPAASGVFTASSFGIDFTLPERAASGKVQIVISRTGGATDGAGDRTIVFSSSFEVAGQHSVSIPSIAAAGSLAAVATVSPATDLVDGAVYTVTLSYQDSVGNTANTVAHTGIVYAGSSTIAPSIGAPTSGAAIATTFSIVSFLSSFSRISILWSIVRVQYSISCCSTCLRTSPVLHIATELHPWRRRTIWVTETIAFAFGRDRRQHQWRGEAPRARGQRVHGRRAHTEHRRSVIGCKSRPRHQRDASHRSCQRRGLHREHRVPGQGGERRGLGECRGHHLCWFLDDCARLQQPCDREFSLDQLYR